MIPRDNFIADVCEGHIDMYGKSIVYRQLIGGPFWTLTTLVLCLYTTSTLTASVTQYLASPETRITANLPLLSTATTLVYLYGLVLPTMLWAATKWLGVADWALAESLGLYGYGMSVFVPVSLLCLIPVGLLRWILVGLGSASSGYFL